MTYSESGEVSKTTSTGLLMATGVLIVHQDSHDPDRRAIRVGDVGQVYHGHDVRHGVDEGGQDGLLNDRVAVDGALAFYLVNDV